MVHDREDLDLDPVAAEMDIVIFGHSHKPLVEEKEGVIWFNPGSAGKRRFSLPVSLGFVEIRGDKINAHWLEIV
jgi:predicted phosphodiesterase